jgi:hypothetical protein
MNDLLTRLRAYDPHDATARERVIERLRAVLEVGRLRAALGVAIELISLYEQGGDLDAETVATLRGYIESALED